MELAVPIEVLDENSNPDFAPRSIAPSSIGLCQHGGVATQPDAPPSQARD